MTQKDEAKKIGLSQNGYRYRLENGIPLDAPIRPGKFSITKAKAKKIWADIQKFREVYPPKTVDVAGMVARHNKVSKSVVNNIRGGRSWNSVTGLPKKIYGDDYA